MLKLAFPAAIIVKKRVYKDIFPDWYTVLSQSRVSNVNNRILKALQSNNGMLARPMSHPLFSNQPIDPSTNTDPGVNQNPNVVSTESVQVITPDKTTMKQIYHPNVSKIPKPTTDFTTRRSRSTSRRKSVPARRLSPGSLPRSPSIQQLRDLV